MNKTVKGLGEEKKGGIDMKHTRWIALIIVLMFLCSTVVSSAASDPAVTIISPVSESFVCSDSLLISIKITQPETIKVYVYEEKQVSGDQLIAVDVNNLSTLQAASGTTPSAMKFQSQEIMVPESFTSTNTLSFYTKQINNVTPGLYKLRVDTIDSAGKVLYSTQNLVAVKGVVSEEEKAKLFDENQSGISQFLQNLLKTIFG